MTAAERLLWNAIQRRANTLSPELGQALLRAFATIRDALTEEEIANAIALGGADRLLSKMLTQAVLDVAFQPARERMRRSIAQSIRYTTKQLPVPPAETKALSVAFDVLNPNVITAIRALEDKVITDLVTDIREMVRAYVENGLRDGLSTAEIARGLRPMIGVPASREVWIRNYEDALRHATTTNKALGYELRDRRFDAMVVKARQTGVPLTEGQIEKATAAMRRRTIAQNANTVSQTATRNAFKLGQRLSWQSAIDRGLVDRSRLMRRWVGVMDDRERDSHKAMERQVRHFDEPYSNGQMIPGEDEHNCRCVEMFFLAPA